MFGENPPTPGRESHFVACVYPMSRLYCPLKAFWSKSDEFATQSGTCSDGGIGRRSGLKIRRPYGCASSTLAPSTSEITRDSGQTRVPFLVLSPNCPQEPVQSQLILLASEKTSIRSELRALARQIDKPAPASAARAVCSMSAGDIETSARCEDWRALPSS
jgi:hypothetical protein